MVNDDESGGLELAPETLQLYYMDAGQNMAWFYQYSVMMEAKSESQDSTCWIRTEMHFLPDYDFRKVGFCTYAAFLPYCCILPILIVSTLISCAFD